MSIAERKSAQRGAPAYLYVFKHENPALIPGTQHKMGTPHAMEITYKFYNVPQPDQQSANAGQQGANAGGGLMSISRPESVKAAHNMAELWSTFARTGKPAAKGQPEWPAYTPQTRATVEIDRNRLDPLATLHGEHHRLRPLRRRRTPRDLAAPRHALPVAKSR